MSIRTFVSLAFVVLAFALPMGSPADTEETPPSWAYTMNPPEWKPAPDDGSIRRVPDSTAGFTLTQLRDLFLAPDWHPADHPPMPEVVAKGRKPDVMACGVCHRADGPGGPENASLFGLPTSYIVQQMTDFKSGVRTTALPQRVPQKLMIATAKAAHDRRSRGVRLVLRVDQTASQHSGRGDRYDSQKLCHWLVFRAFDYGREGVARPTHRRSSRRCGTVCQP